MTPFQFCVGVSVVLYGMTLLFIVHDRPKRIWFRAPLIVLFSVIATQFMIRAFLFKD